MTVSKILVSACLLGDKVRYDGAGKPCLELLSFLKNKNIEVHKLCPEMLGGLPVPRIPAEIDEHTDKVLNKSGTDVSKQFLLGAESTLKYCQNNEIKIAVLKSKSPSCGKDRIYDGTFSGRLRDGAGCTARLLMQNGIDVFDETELEKLEIKLKE